MLPPLTLSFLQALGYPRLDAALDLAAPEQLQSLIGWLENTKIRLYPAGGPERQGLTAAAADAFPPALCKYLEDLECPHPWDGGSNRDCVVHWLLAHAVGLEFDDAAERLGGVIQEAVQRTPPAQEWTRRDLPAFPDALAPEVGAALRDWLAELHVEVEAGEEATPAALRRARAVLESQVLPAAAWQESHPGEALTPGALLEGVPLGFSTGDAAVDVGAKALRMLHVAGLRRLQAAADEGLERMQALTANPRTDTGHTGKGRA